MSYQLKKVVTDVAREQVLQMKINLDDIEKTIKFAGEIKDKTYVKQLDRISLKQFPKNIVNQMQVSSSIIKLAQVAPVSELRQWNPTFLQHIEMKAREGGFKNLIWTFAFDSINQPYVLVRAFLNLPDRSIAGTGLTPRQKFEDSMGGLTTVFSAIVPLKVDVIKGITKNTTFKEFSRLTQGTYHSFEQMWKALRGELLKLELNEGHHIDEIIKSTDILKGLKKDIETNGDTTTNKE